MRFTFDACLVLPIRGDCFVLVDAPCKRLTACMLACRQLCNAEVPEPPYATLNVGDPGRNCTACPLSEQRQTLSGSGILILGSLAQALVEGKLQISGPQEGDALPELAHAASSSALFSLQEGLCHLSK